MHNFIAYFRKGGDFLKSYWAKWPRKEVTFFQGKNRKRGRVQHLTCEPLSIFKTFGLVRLSRILSYTNQHEPRIRQVPKLSRVSCVTIQLTVRVWSHEPGKQCAWTVCDPLPCSRLVHSPGRPASVITWKISTRDPGITILGSHLTGLARLSCNRKVDVCCV